MSIYQLLHLEPGLSPYHCHALLNLAPLTDINAFLQNVSLPKETDNSVVQFISQYLFCHHIDTHCMFNYHVGRFC